MMASVSAPIKLLYQIPRSAIFNGMFFSGDASAKCRSIAAAPSRRDSKFSYPTDKAIESPTALQSENLPPTQSAIANTFSFAIPNCPVIPRFVETAAKCKATSASEA